MLGWRSNQPGPGSWRKHRKGWLFGDRAEENFIRHNKRVWADSSPSLPSGEVLCEFTTMQPSIIAYSYFAHVLGKKHNARVLSYMFGIDKSIDPGMRRLYESFNVEIFTCAISEDQRDEIGNLYEETLPRLITKQDVFNFSIDNIWIGDLLYDHHLRRYKVPTVDVKDSRFKVSLREALTQFIYWRDYLRSHDVRALNVTHCVYLVAIPLRLSIDAGVPTYQCNAQGCYHLSEERLWPYSNFYSYPADFAALSQDEQQVGIKMAKENIARRFDGEVGVNMAYSQKSAYTSKRIDRVLSTTNKLKVLIAMQCFFDSPNGLGPNLFVDFYEWLKFLGGISNQTDYEWYLKTHPDAFPENIAILEKMVAQYPKMTMIPNEVSHHQLIEEGIDVALTVYGTIGLEYAALGLPVINASTANPHIAYNFNIHPRTFEEYERTLKNLESQKVKIKMSEVYEYYCMNHIAERKDTWLISDYSNYMSNVGYAEHFNSDLYQYFVDKFSPESSNNSICWLSNFVESKDYSMGRKHSNMVDPTGLKPSANGF